MLEGRGRVRVGAPDNAAKRLMVEVFRAGDVFGEIGVLDGATRSADAVVIGEVKLARIPAAAFLETAQSEPALGLALARLLSMRLRRTFGLLQDATFAPLEVRLARQVLYLLKADSVKTDKGVRLAARFRQGDLADLLGATTRSIISILNAWRASNLVVLRHREGLPVRAGRGRAGRGGGRAARRVVTRGARRDAGRSWRRSCSWRRRPWRSRGPTSRRRSRRLPQVISPLDPPAEGRRLPRVITPDDLPDPAPMPRVLSPAQPSAAPGAPPPNAALAACTPQQVTIVNAALVEARARIAAAIRLLQERPDHPHLRLWFGSAPPGAVLNVLQRTGTRLASTAGVELHCNDPAAAPAGSPPMRGP